jgi:homoserine O-acetyltransferase
MAEELTKQVKTATFVLIDGGHGHGSHTWAALWKDKLVDLLARTAR